MPPAKRIKSSADSRPNAGASGRPTLEDLEGENQFTNLARQHWLNVPQQAAKIKVKTDVLKRELWDALERENFPLKSLLILEGLQILERQEGPLILDLFCRTLTDRMSQIPVARLRRGFIKLPCSFDHLDR